jgi:cell division septum initiation protein DivIVA
MKKFFRQALLVAFIAIVAASFVAPALGQSEKIKQKAKDLKKEVEGGKQATNKPPQAPKPPPPPPPAPPKK